MLYRKLDDAGDYRFGRGSADFWRDQPEAVAQAVKTRLALWQGEWFLDTREGMAWTTRVLGNRTSEVRDPTIRRRILQTQGVSGLTAYSSDFDSETRQFKVSATVSTIYGPAVVTGGIGS